MDEAVCGQGPAISPGRKVHWRRDPAILGRLPVVDRMRLARRTQAEIAAKVGISEATVRDDIKRLNELWLERIQGEQASHRAEVLAELDDVRIRALEAAEFDESAERAVLFGDPMDDPDGNPQTVYRDKKGSAQFRGNKAAALAQARQATMDKAKLLGLVVDKAALTDTAGDDIPLAELMVRFSQRQAESTAPDGDS